MIKLYHKGVPPFQNIMALRVSKNNAKDTGVPDGINEKYNNIKK